LSPIEDYTFQKIERVGLHNFIMFIEKKNLHIFWSKVI